MQPVVANVLDDQVCQYRQARHRGHARLRTTMAVPLVQVPCQSMVENSLKETFDVIKFPFVFAHPDQ